MRIQTRAIADALVTHAEGTKPTELKEAAKLIIGRLAAEGQLHRIRDIIRMLDGAWHRKYGIASIKIESAITLPESVRKTIESASNGASIEHHVRPELLGGARIRIDDRLIDATVAGRLQQLRRTFQENV